MRTAPGAAMMSGYLHPYYAFSLAEFGAPVELPRSRGWILKRRIPGCHFYDAMGCYPLFSCQDWQQLYYDLEELRGELISIALVTDPFGNYDEAQLKDCFQDVVIPFKKHYIVDLSQSLDSFISSHHRRNAGKALRYLGIEKCDDPMRFLDDWADLYSFLIARHRIRGIPAFSKSSFARQIKVPGLLMFRAVYEGATVGMSLWYRQKAIGYYHLGACNALGYQLRASYALFRSVIEYSAQAQLKWLDLGGGAGIADADGDGLSRFKRGWSTGIRTAYFCGRVLDRQKYREIVTARGAIAADYFPAYRRGEFG